ncbi:MAG: 3',5'-cyclic-nucleotide phosphodiesterase, partial [Oceanospirillales bacterium]|nr:3',5'-cyclic-nucleotide phosphodiesterase [Oceanospirillales bacterium]
MKIDILGCSGGIGPGLHTTAFRVDKHLLVDAGSGVGTLTLEQMLDIRSVIITHAHIDHILGLPLMLATIYDQHTHPVHVYASSSVISALKDHIFNWTIWPDFTQLPAERPILQLHTVDPDSELEIENYRITTLPADHPSPAVGYLVNDGQSSFAFTGDSGYHPPFWHQVNRHQPELIIVDISFTDDARELANDSGHMTSSQLQQALALLDYTPDVRITHLKAGFEQAISAECSSTDPIHVAPLHHGEILN